MRYFFILANGHLINNVSFSPRATPYQRKDNIFKWFFHLYYRKMLGGGLLNLLLGIKINWILTWNCHYMNEYLLRKIDAYSHYCWCIFLYTKIEKEVTRETETDRNKSLYQALRVFHTWSSWWYSIEVWITASLLRSPELFSVFWPILTMLKPWWPSFLLWFLILPVPFPNMCSKRNN